MDIYTLAGARLKLDTVESTSVAQNPVLTSTAAEPRRLKPSKSGSCFGTA